MRETLDEFGVRPELLPPDRIRQLDRDGYCRFDAFVDDDQIAAMLDRITELLETGGRQGTTLHVKGLVDAGSMFDVLWLRPELLAAVTHLLGADFHVGQMHYRAGTPGHGVQALHTDTTESGGPGAWPVCNSIVALTAFTEVNGATRVVPGSQLAERFRRPKGFADHPDQVLLTGPAGTCWLFNSHVWHSGTLNRSDSPRHAVLTSFYRRGSAPIGAAVPPSETTIRRLGTAAYLLI